MTYDVQMGKVMHNLDSSDTKSAVIGSNFSNHCAGGGIHAALDRARWQALYAEQRTTVCRREFRLKLSPNRQEGGGLRPASLLFLVQLAAEHISPARG